MPNLILVCPGCQAKISVLRVYTDFTNIIKLEANCPCGKHVVGNVSLDADVRKEQEKSKPISREKKA